MEILVERKKGGGHHFGGGGNEKKTFCFFPYRVQKGRLLPGEGGTRFSIPKGNWGKGKSKNGPLGLGERSTRGGIGREAT